MSRYRIGVLDENAFGGMREEWDALLSRSNRDNVFLTWEWLSAWWRHFRMPSWELAVVSVRDPAGRLVGIAPMYQEPSGSWGSSRTLRFLGTGPACSEYLDLIVERALEAEVSNELVGHLVEKSRLCFLELTDFPLGSRHLADLDRSIRGANVRSVTVDGDICPFLELPQTSDGFFAALKPKKRSNYKRAVKKFRDRFGTTSRRVESSGCLQSVYDSLFALHGARLTAKGRESSFLSEEMRGFHLDVGKAFLERGWLRIYALEDAERVVGSLYGFAYGKRMSYYQTGFDPEYDAWNVGEIMVGAAIEDAIAQGMMEFDFLRGAESYKWHWTNTYRKSAHLISYPSSLAGAFRYGYDRLRRATSHALRSAGGKTGDPDLAERRQLVGLFGGES